MTTRTAESISTKLTAQWEQVGEKLTALAEALPADKYDYKPVDGVRTVGDVLRHVAFWNQYVAASARGTKFNDSANELPHAEYAAKAGIIRALKLSVADGSAALRERSEEVDPGTADMIITFLEHTSEHYGQLAVYARLNGVVPPATSGQ